MRNPPDEATTPTSRARALSRISLRVAILAIALGAAIAGVLAVQSGSASDAPHEIAQADAVTEGKQLFQQYCVGCHTIGGGVLVGPDLQGVTERRDRNWLISWIENPEKVRASGDPIAKELDAQFPVPMPNLGLTRAQVEQIVDYLATQTGGGAPAASPVAAALLPGNAEHGKELFIGNARFSAGGSACIACHSAGGVGALGGGQLGPDLTQSVSKFGEAGLDAFLANPPTQTMSAVWSAHPMTPQERADIRAFLTQAAVIGRPANTVLQLALFAVVGAAILLVLAQLIWRKRVRSVRKNMVAAARR
ncbi:MAG: cytochrome c [Thermomicrobiales bacterium]|nr:cytochrome c [Thermomicrobiales bacterium]